MKIVRMFMNKFVCECGHENESAILTLKSEGGQAPIKCGGCESFWIVSVENKGKVPSIGINVMSGEITPSVDKDDKKIH